MIMISILVSLSS